MISATLDLLKMVMLTDIEIQGRKFSLLFQKHLSRKSGKTYFWSQIVFKIIAKSQIRKRYLKKKESAKKSSNIEIAAKKENMFAAGMAETRRL